MDVRLIVHPPDRGSWNMAVDQVLLDSATETTTLRFYGWSPPALSLGYFQRVADRKTHAASRELSVVRRATGGGAIVHDNELTYCLATPLGDRFQNTEKLVAELHQELVAALGDWGIVPQLSLNRVPASTGEPFLCFQRRARHDVLLQGSKVAGSAQRRLRGRALIHGSVLLRRSRFAPELPGIDELAGSHLVADQLADSWAARLAEHFGWHLHRGGLEPPELDACQQVCRAKFDCNRWTNRR